MRGLVFQILFLLGITNLCFSQCQDINLVKNPGLEDYSCCPLNMGLIDCADNWFQPLYYSTSDYFNMCCWSDTNFNPAGMAVFNKHPFWGDAMAGSSCLAWGDTINLLREYIEGTLREDLISGKCYYVEFWTLPSNYNSVTIDALGVYFSDTAISLPYDTVWAPGDTLVYIRNLYYPSQINNPTGNVIKDTVNWAKISGAFYASGGERYFLIGNFKPPNEVNKFVYQPASLEWSYYFYDNFSICPCEDTLVPAEQQNVFYVPNIFTPNNDGQNDIIFVRGENISAIEFSVYDRWGSLLFETKDLNTGWDGRYKSKACGNGVYFYTAQVTFNNGETLFKKGNFTLIQ
jgi:gliding motility-associated-like protein